MKESQAHTDLPMNTASEKSGGLLLVVSGPSGVGKTTITREIERRLGGVFSVSATTRPQADGEVNGRDYFFITEHEFEQKVADGDFLEHAKVYGEFRYGTPREPVENQVEAGQIVILDIDVQGARQVKEAMPQAFTIFIFPPSDEELLRRLKERRREDEASIKRRFAEAKREIQFAESSTVYDAHVVNDDLERAIEETCCLINHRRTTV